MTGFGKYTIAQIVLMQDNLSTHKPASRYEASPKRIGRSSDQSGIYTNRLKP